MKLPEGTARRRAVPLGNLKSTAALGEGLSEGFSDRGSIPLASTNGYEANPKVLLNQFCLNTGTKKDGIPNWEAVFLYECSLSEQL